MKPRAIHCMLLVLAGVLARCDELRTVPLPGYDAGTDATLDAARPLDAGCDGGACRQGNGAACTGNAQCTSTFCSDGVCCNTACHGQCEYCNGSVAGTCAAVTGQPQGGRTACSGTGACAQACTGTDRTACALPTGSTCPVCGDRVCETGETCASCPGDCGPCAVPCVGCSSDNPCSDAGVCQRRSCDGTLGCFTPGGPACESIDNVACPAVSAYMTCVMDMDCGPFASCLNFSDTGPTICSRACQSNADCPDPPAGFTGAAAECFPDQGQCVLECSGPGACPYGLTCQPFSTGGGGYCD